MAGFIHHQRIVCHGLLAPTIVFGQVAPAVFLFDIQEPCSTVIPDDFMTIVVKQPGQFIEMTVPQTLSRCFENQGLILCSGTSTMSVAAVDERARDILANWSPRFADLSNEPPRPTPSRGELEERRRRLAELQARLRAEREAQTAEELQEEPGRMALIEPDPAADPGASIRAWEERQEAAKAAAKLRPGLMTEREREPPRGPTVELVDATRLGFWLGRLYALANTDLPDTRLGARLGPKQRASGRTACCGCLQTPARASRWPTGTRFSAGSSPTRSPSATTRAFWAFRARPTPPPCRTARATSRSTARI